MGFLSNQESVVQAQSLIFKSNFGNGVTVSAPYGYYTSGTGAWQDLTGLDSETGYNWSNKPLNADFFGMQLITYDLISSTTIDSYIHNEIQEVIGPKGTLSKILFQTVKKKPVALGSSQDPLLLKRPWTVGDVKDLYISYWFKHKPDLAAQLDPLISSGNWHAQFEFKTGGYKDTYGGDYRIQTTIMKGTDNKLYWMSRADNNANAGLPPDDYWRVDNHTVPVPVGSWFKFEVYWHRSTGSDGRYWAAVNGQVIADYFGKNIGSSNLPITRIFIDTTYSGGYPPIESRMTGLEIWSGFPCGVGKSCFNATVAPIVSNPIKDQIWNESTSNSFIIPANSFADPNGDTLTYSASQPLSATLPTGMTFTPSSRKLSGTPPRGIKTFTIRITAKDPKGATIYDDFNIKINNKPHVISALPDQKWNEAKPSSYIIPSNAFGDIDGDTLTLSVAGLPSWMNYTSSTRTLSGTPPRGIASHTIRVTAKDPQGLTVYDDFTVKVNNRPNLVTAMGDQSWKETVYSTFTVPAATFADLDGDTLTYTAKQTSGAKLPDWMIFSPATRTLSGTPPPLAENVYVQINATDPSGLYMYDQVFFGTIAK